jgi:hypothetical protein
MKTMMLSALIVVIGIGLSGCAQPGDQGRRMVPKKRMFSVPAIYVLGPLQIGVCVDLGGDAVRVDLDPGHVHRGSSRLFRGIAAGCGLKWRCPGCAGAGSITMPCSAS